MEYYMRPESRMSQIPKPKQFEGRTKSDQHSRAFLDLPVITLYFFKGESRAQYGWRLIRQCVRDAIDVSLKTDMKELLVVHGVHQNRRILHPNTICQMIMNKTTKVG